MAGSSSTALGWRVWLSGASSGLGEAIARELASRDCRLALFARREDVLSLLRDELVRSRPGLDVLLQAGDVRNRARVQEAIAEAEERFGGLDVLLINAGTGDSLFPENFDVELVERIFGVNVMGAIYCIGAALPGMLARNSGRIVGISSIAGTRGFPASAPYCASKAAFTTFLESLRLDLTGTGVRVITVSPGFIKTPLTDRNRFPMPFLQPPDRAARWIVKGIERGKREIHFPKRLSIPVKLLRCVPGPVYDFLMRRILPGGLRKEPAEGGTPQPPG
jgi:short-subunit dehydrogenase